MTGVTLLAVAVALGVDAFAVATAVGLCHVRLQFGPVVRLSSAFGLFQFGMPVLGWLAGAAVHDHIAAVDHWVAFGLLALVGGRMIFSALRGGPEQAIKGDPSQGWNLLVLSVATSIDAFAVGLGIAAIGSPILIPAIVIGVMATLMTAVGMAIGCRIGAASSRGFEALGGLVLIAIGLRILFEHLG